MDYFIAGGKLKDSARSYLERNTDDLLLTFLIKREYTSILASRQMGKSSLIQRTITKIETLGNSKTIFFDLSTDSMTTEEKFYSKLLTEISKKFDIEFDFYKFQNKLRISPAHKLFQEYLIELPLSSDSGLIIFFDEIDSLFRKQISETITINLFSTIRSLYNLRGNLPQLTNLTFCLSGVLPPNKLLDDPYSTPFNIGTPIRLKNIERKRFISYEKEFTNFKGDKSKLLDSIFSWTNGHPYLTQFLCKIILEECQIKESENVETFLYKVIHDIILSEDKLYENNTHFPNIQQYIMGDEKNRTRAIELYSRIWYGEKIIDNSLIESQEFLKNSGLIMEKDKYLTISNKIYENYFNDLWIARMNKNINRPFNEHLLLWLEENKNPDFAILAGKELKEAETWTKTREDITQNEIQFLNQCSANERSKKKKNNLTIIFSLIFLLLSAILLVSILNYNHNIQKAELEKKNLLQIKDNTEYLRLIQNERINPGILYNTINEYRVKYKPFVFIYLPIHSMKLISVQNYKKSLRYKQLFCRVVDKF